MKKVRVKQIYNTYVPKSANQQQYVNYLNEDKNMVIVVGPAGTGKTMFACLRAIELLKSGDINKIVITRPVVTVEEDIGFLPGNIAKKMDPWTKPIFDIFEEYYPKSEVDNFVYNNVIEICPLAFMRGRTFKNSFIIADEMQNSSPNQMKMLTTRIGVNSKMIITGDLAQSDLPRDNGLSDLMTKLKNYRKYCQPNESSIRYVELEKSDIERSDLVKTIIGIYDFKQPYNTTLKYNFNTINVTNAGVINGTTVINGTSLIIDHTNTTNNTIINTKPNNKNNDCALIPKHHKSKYYPTDYVPDFSMYY